MRIGKAILIALAAIAILQVLTLAFRTERIETDMMRRAQEILASSDAVIGMEQVAFEGRDATLRGSVPSEQEKLRVQALLEVYPIRVVHNELVVDDGRPTVAAAPALDPASALFALSPSDGEGLRLSGRMPDAATRERLAQSVRDAFPTRDVEDAMTVDAGMTPLVWADGVVAMMPALSAVARPYLLVGADVAQLRGEVPSETQRTVVSQDAVASLAGALRLHLELDIAAQPVLEESAALRQLRQQLGEVLAGHQVQFRINTAELVPASQELLQRVAAVLRSFPDIDMEVQGHTDILGSIATNNALSQTRADAVRTYLIGQGVDADRLTAVGYGPTKPVATNTTREGRIKNRRVEFSLKGGS